MRRTLLLTRASSATTHVLLPCLPSSTNVTSSSKASNFQSTSPSTSNSKWAAVTNSLPPPEWVEPFNDISDVISSPQRFDPSPWVPQILNLLDGSPEMEHNLDSYCRKFLIKLSPNFVAHVLKSGNLNPETAVRFFTWSGKQKKYQHKLECYVCLIEVLCLSGDIDGVKNVAVELRKMCFLMNLNAANSLIKCFGSVGMVEELLWVWRGMKENGIEPSLFTYNFLVNGLVNSMFIQSAEKVFEVMECGKIAPDVVSYNTMTKGYCKAGKTGKALEKFRSMEGRNAEADKITYDFDAGVLFRGGFRCLF